MPSGDVVHYIYKILLSCAITSCTLSPCIARSLIETPSLENVSNTVISGNPIGSEWEDDAVIDNTKTIGWPTDVFNIADAWSHEKVDYVVLRDAWSKYWIPKDKVIACKQETLPIWERKNPPMEFVQTKEAQWLTAVQWLGMARVCKIDTTNHSQKYITALQQLRMKDPQNSWIYVLRVHYWLAIGDPQRAKIDLLNVIALDTDKKWQEAVGLAWHMESWRIEQVTKKNIIFDAQDSLPVQATQLVQDDKKE